MNLDDLRYDRLQQFLGEFIPSRPEEMLVMERYAEEKSFPIIGPIAGHFCYQVARLINATQIFEMGSGYGYSTAWFSQAIKDNCIGKKMPEARVHHVVWDAKLSSMAVGHLANLGLNELVEYHVGEAVETLGASRGSFDLIFNDIDKQAYPASLPVIKEKLRPGGVLLADNLLWNGRIFDESERSPATNGIREFTRLISQDPDWIISILPLRDGLLMAFKK